MEHNRIMDILILGAGYGGLRVAVELNTLLRDRRHQVQVTLVDQNPYHQIIQEFHLVATAAISKDDAAMALSHILERRDVRFRQGRVTSINVAGRRVSFADGEALSYDYLVIALGSETSYANIPGAREHTIPLRTIDDAVHLRDHIFARYREAATTVNPQQRRILMTIAIIGAGYTGCQLAGELSAWAPELCRITGAPYGDVRIPLLEHSPLLLRHMGQWASDEAARVLDRRRVSVYLNTDVERVEAGVLHVSDNRMLRAGTLVWAGGVKAPDLLADSGLPTDETGRALVDRYLRVQDQARVFALGDCAHVPDAQGEAVPATASYAMRQGEHLARSLLADIEGQSPKMYEPMRLGEVVSLGPDEAVGNPLGGRIFGPAAVLLKKGIAQWYISTLR